MDICVGEWVGGGDEVCSGGFQSLQKSPLAHPTCHGQDLSRAVEERAWEKAEAEAQGEARTREAQLLRAQCAELTGRLEALQRDRQRLEQDIQALTTDRQEETERWVAARAASHLWQTPPPPREIVPWLHAR